jgi:hypothetical protein
MLLTLSNPGLPLAIIGNPSPRRRRGSKENSMLFLRRRARRARRTRRSLSRKQLAALRKGWKLMARRHRRSRRNPGTKSGARKARRKGRRKQMRARRLLARRYARKLRGFKIVVRRKAGRRKASRRFTRKYGIKTGRRGTISFRAGKGKRKKLVATNPRRRRSHRRRSHRRNPSIGAMARGWTGGLTGLTKAPSLFKGKDLLPSALFAAGGMVGSLVAGGVLRGTIMGVVGKFAPTLAANTMVQGVLGAAISYTGGYAAGTLLIKDAKKRQAFITGAAAAAVLGLIFPGKINALLIKIPVLGPMLAKMPGMSGYVSAPAYQGVGIQDQLAGYVSAPAYQGVQGLGYDDALAGELGAYVNAPAYQGVGIMASHLDQ